MIDPTADRLPLIPSPNNAQVWIDFDGTITSKDVLDELIMAFAADDSWRAVEAAWQAGHIGSFECLTAEFDSVRVGHDRLRCFLDDIPVDPGVAAFFESMSRWKVPVAVVSDGVESFIHAILARERVGPVVARANRVEHVDDRLRLICPHRVEGCRSRAAHCKCGSINDLGDGVRRSIYIGDGRSDLCPARAADLVFAKGVLARLLQAEGIPFIAFETLHDVAKTLATAWQARRAAV